VAATDEDDGDGDDEAAAAMAEGRLELAVSSVGVGGELFEGGGGGVCGKGPSTSL